MAVLLDPHTGYLPLGVHPFDWADFLVAFAWNPLRIFLAGGLHRALSNLKGGGCRAALVDGSYVTAKPHPGDYDMAFDPNGMNGAHLDPVLLRHDDGRKAMKAKYFGDIVPWGAVACAATGMIYQDFFQKDRDGQPKGVVLLNVRALP